MDETPLIKSFFYESAFNPKCSKTREREFVNHRAKTHRNILLFILIYSLAFLILSLFIDKYYFMDLKAFCIKNNIPPYHHFVFLIFYFASLFVFIWSRLNTEISEHLISVKVFKQSALKYKFLVQESPYFVLHWNKNEEIVFVNRYLKKFFTIKKADIDGKRINDLFSENIKNNKWLKDFFEMIEKVKNSTGENELFFETTFINNNEQLIWVSWIHKFYNNLETDEKEIHTIGTDISIRKNTEEKLKYSLAEKELLLREVHHRVKNSLAIVSSLIGLQISHEESENEAKALKALNSRIKSIGLVHEKLYRKESISEISIHDYLKDLIDNILSSFSLTKENIKISFNIKNYFFDSDKTIALGLLITEIITNAIKHSFPCSDDDAIYISLQRDNSYYYLNIKNNGKPFPEDLDINNLDSLGFKIILSLADQLDGKIDLINRKTTEFMLMFKS